MICVEIHFIVGCNEAFQAVWYPDGQALRSTSASQVLFKECFLPTS